MLTIAEAVDYQTSAARTKSELSRHPGIYLVQAMLAGAYIGIGVVIMATARGPLADVGSGWTPLVQGIVFGVALTIVVIAGAELATSAMMILTQGALRRSITWGRGGARSGHDVVGSGPTEEPSEHRDLGDPLGVGHRESLGR